MKDFKHFGVKRRVFKGHNYDAIWMNLKTIRLGEGAAIELPCDKSEFYDVSLGPVCRTGRCKFCYVASNPNGAFYQDICETWKKWMATFMEGKSDKTNITYTDKPFQIAIGSEGEPTEHPEFCQFLQTVYETGVVPNYTTNGVILSADNDLSKMILDYTAKYVGGVAVSFGNENLRENARKAVEKLMQYGDCHINLHHIISTKESVDQFVEVWKEYGDNIKYHVLLPLMPAGRSKKGIEDGVFEYLEQKIEEYDMKNVAFGAHFVKYLKNSSIKTWLYEPESFSKNVLLKKDNVVITPSSFDIKAMKEIHLDNVESQVG